MTVLEERIKRLQDASDTVSAQALEDVLEQGKKAAANMLLIYGGQTCKDSGGFVHCVQRAHEAALLFLVSEGYVTLTEKALAPDDEQEAKRNRRLLAMKNEPSEGEKVLGAVGGQYL